MSAKNKHLIYPGYIVVMAREVVFKLGKYANKNYTLLRIEPGTLFNLATVIIGCMHALLQSYLIAASKIIVAYCSCLFLADPLLLGTLQQCLLSAVY